MFVTVAKDGKLAIETRPNQDNPMMDGKRALFGNDVWEHAYYLNYQNRRADYLKAWWNTVNWARISERYAGGKGRHARRVIRIKRHEKGRPFGRPFLSLLSASPQARSKRSRFMTLVQAATKSFTNFSFESVSHRLPRRRGAASANRKPDRRASRSP